MALLFVKYSEVSLINYRFLFLGNYIQLNIENVDLNKALIHLIYFFSFFFIWCKLIFNTFSSAFTSVKLTAAWTVFIHFYIFWYSVLLWRRIRKEKVKKKPHEIEEEGWKERKRLCVCVILYLYGLGFITSREHYGGFSLNVDFALSIHAARKQHESGLEAKVSSGWRRRRRIFLCLKLQHRCLPLA